MNLKKGCEESVELRQRWLREVLKAQIRIEELPVEITELECGNCGVDAYSQILQISIYPPYELEEDSERLQWVGQTKLLLESILGVEWNKQIKCYRHSDSLYWIGKTDKLQVTIFNAPKPLLCKITQTKEMKEIITYKAECPEEVLI